MADPVRIQLYLARLGYGSRREIESWIRSGKVLVNARPAKLGDRVDPETDILKVKGEFIRGRRPKDVVVLAMHKPRGCLTTKDDPQGRLTVMNLLPKKLKVFPVGRLDLNSEGLLLLTNDGDLAYRLTHPKYEVPKVYEVKIRGNLSEKKIEHLKKGVRVGGIKYSPAEILGIREVTQEGVKKFIVKVKVHEGKNHHVRKLFDAVACRVIRLKRISVGSVDLKGIPRGEFRVLPTSAVDKLRKELSSEAMSA